MNSNDRHCNKCGYDWRIRAKRQRKNIKDRPQPLECPNCSGNYRDNIIDTEN